jgi:DnaJ family protein C protein 7
MEALKDINKSIQLNERYWKAYMRRGNIYMTLNMYEEAKYDFQKVKDNDPSNKDIHKLLEDSKKEEAKAKKRDYYKILDIDRNASTDDIRKAYKKLALKWHPDRNSESEESKKMAEKMFRDINDAYSVLSDAKKKRMYDAGSDPLNPEEGGSNIIVYDIGGMDGMHFGGDHSDMFNMFFGGGGPESKFLITLVFFNMNDMGGGFPGGFRTGGSSKRQSGKSQRSNGGFTFNFK